ncbi:MAG: DUF2587 domain-containing protein [Acidimicrobiia bacterium]|nr:DUF2587 domain-containing protein [Acidimicrobiia bacterium]
MDSGAPAERPEIIDAGAEGNADGEAKSEVIEQPAKIMRIGTMIRALLEEARNADLDEAGRDKLRVIYDTSVKELASTLSPDLEDELMRLTHPFSADGQPSGSELRIAQAQLVGWLEGLFQGIQATMFAQQVAARQQLESMRQLPQGMGPQGPPGDGRAGTYL